MFLAFEFAHYAYPAVKCVAAILTLILLKHSIAAVPNHGFGTVPRAIVPSLDRICANRFAARRSETDGLSGIIFRLVARPRYPYLL